MQDSLPLQSISLYFKEVNEKEGKPGKKALCLYLSDFFAISNIKVDNVKKEEIPLIQCLTWHCSFPALIKDAKVVLVTRYHLIRTFPISKTYFLAGVRKLLNA